MKKIMYLSSMGKVIRAKVDKSNNTRFCISCEKWFEQTREHWIFHKGKPRTNYCKPCYNKRKPKIVKTTENTRVLPDPHTFQTENHRKELHEWMEKLGWRWHKSGNYWSKPGVVNEDGTWVNMPPDVEKPFVNVLTYEQKLEIKDTFDEEGRDFILFQSRYNVTRKRIDGALSIKDNRIEKVFDDNRQRDRKGRIVPQRPNRINPYRYRMTDEEKLEMIRMIEEGQKIPDVAKHFDRTSSAIRYTMKAYYGKTKG